MANSVKLIPQRDMSKHLAKDDKVQAHLKAHANKMAARARGLLAAHRKSCLLYTSPSPRDGLLSRMPSSA